ncbi:MAG TPA: membrane protein insertase YidC [bacterium]|nr:membrane protein insertase YidC [bacterium]
MDNQSRRLILFIAVSVVIYVICYRFLPQPPPPAAAPVAKAQLQPTPALPPVKHASLALPVSSRGSWASASVTISTDLYTAIFSNEGAVLTSYELKKYPNRQTGQPIQLVNPDPGHPRPFALADDSLPDLASQKYEIKGSSQTLAKGQSADLVFRALTASGTVVEKKLHFTGGSYLIGFDLTLAQNRGQLAASPLELEWADTLGVEENTGTQSRVQGYRVVTAAGDHLDTQNAKKSQESTEIPAPITWTALSNQFFVAALIPDASTGGASAKVVRDFNIFKEPTPENPNPGLDLKTFAPRPWLVFPGQALRAGESFERKGQVFLGPQDYYLLKSLNLGLESVVNFGTFKFISVYMLQLLRWFDGFCHNWGLAIILLSILVKLLLWFPTHSSYKSMYLTQQKMKELQPKLEALKRKYADDKERQNKETQELYAKAGVNPLGGCLPMLLQIPIFFALYSTLSHSIELRGAGFLWLKDLTLMDPYHVLPLLMGASMVVQQRVSGQAASNAPGQQKFMMWFFPIFLTVFSFQWPSGLLIYWVVTNLLSIIQQKEVNREIKKEKKKDEA